jgi:hypothetical protein
MIMRKLTNRSEKIGKIAKQVRLNRATWICSCGYSSTKESSKLSGYTSGSARVFMCTALNAAEA